MKISIVATSGKSLIDFRGRLITSLSQMGHDVDCVSIEPENEMEEMINGLGASYHQVSGDRVGIGFFSGLKMIRKYKEYFTTNKPDLCLLYMSKPIAFGGFAAIRAGVKHINILVNGLENAFYQHSLRDWIVRRVLLFFYRFVSSHADCVMLQNHDDYNYFKKKKVAKPQKMTVVNGSGVDMDYYKREPLPDNPVFLMVARLLWTKGIKEYLEAIRIVKRDYPQTKFMLVGGLDESKEGLSKSELEKCIRDYDLEYCGFANDVRPYLKRCSVFVLPSYHEGTPRSILEALATGRAIITTDAPGCKETVIDGVNGFIVPVGDSQSLARSMLELVNNEKKREAMSLQSFALCADKYEVEKVNKEMISIMMNPPLD